MLATHENSIAQDKVNNLSLYLNQKIEELLGKEVYSSWFTQFCVKEFSSKKVIFSVSTRFNKDWIINHYYSDLLSMCQQYDTSILCFDVIVEENNKEKTNNNKTVANTTKGSDKQSYLSSLLSLDSRYTFQNFVVGKSNEFAYAAARKVAESETVDFNPLFLYGGVGLGKTHLMHAIAWHILQHHSKRKVIYLSAEKFMFEFIRALRYKDTMTFKEQFRSVDVLMIDDVQFISGKNSTQEEFFHTFNTLVDSKRQVIISADKSPIDLDGIEERVKSRLGWGLVADIHPTDFELRMGILQSLADKNKLKFEHGTLDYIARNISSNVRELEGAFNRIYAHIKFVSKNSVVSKEEVVNILKNMLKSFSKDISISYIQKIVAHFYNIKLTNMYSNRRVREFVRPRQIAMSICKRLTTKSLPEIGREFGGRDHTTVIHSIRAIKNYMERDSILNKEYDLLVKKIQEGEQSEL